MPARIYSVRGSQNVNGTTDSVIAITSTSAIRPYIFDIIFGSSASPADNAIQWLLQRATAAGAGDAVTPQAADSQNPASTATSISNHSTEPTYTSAEILLDIVANQRSTQRWVAAPGSDLICPAIAANGLGLQPLHSSFTGLVESTMLFGE